jgi:hypothetical protein
MSRLGVTGQVACPPGMRTADWERMRRRLAELGGPPVSKPVTGRGENFWWTGARRQD